MSDRKDWTRFAAMAAILALLAGGAQGQSGLRLSSLSPASGPVGTVVQLEGIGFTATSNTVHFGSGGKANLNSSSNGTQISYTIPSTVGLCDLMGPGCKGPTRMVTPESYPIYVTNARGRSNSLTFEVTK